MSNEVDTTTAVTVGLEAALRDAADGVFVLDRNRKIAFFSEACRRITGATSGDVLGLSCVCHEMLECVDVHGRRLEGVLCPALSILNGDITSHRQRMAISRQDGQRVWVETTYAPIRDGQGRITGVVAIMRDINDVIAREEELIAAARRGSATQDTESTVIDAPDNGDGIGALDNKLSSLERLEIVDALANTRGQRTQAAQRLGISRSRLYRRMEALGIDPRQLSASDGD